jgi:hypothetical protein
VKPFRRHQLLSESLRGVGLGFGWVLAWTSTAFLAGPATDFLLWPLGIALGALLQKGMLELRLRSVDRRLLRHPGINDWVGDWVLCRPFLARLATERARLLVGEEAIQEIDQEERDWARILGPKLVVATGFQRLILLDHQSKWAGRLRFRGRLPKLTPGDLGIGLLGFLGVFAALWATQAFAEFFLYWMVPYFFITPYWETRMHRQFSVSHMKRLASWRRA